MTFGSGFPNVYDEINRSMPTGGVRNPIERFMRNMTAACTAEIPNVSASGRRRGDTMSIAENISMRHPTMSSTIFIRIRNTYLFDTYCVMNEAKTAGMFESSI